MIKLYYIIFLGIFFTAKSHQFSLENSIASNKTGIVKSQKLQLENSKNYKSENRVDSIAIYFRQYKLKKCAQLIYELEPKLEENSYEMGMLVFHKGLIFEEINDEVNYKFETERLAKIANNLKDKDQSILLYCYVIGNQIEAEYQKNNKKEVQKLLQKALDTLDHISTKNKTSEFYFQKGRTYYLMSYLWVEFNNLKKADSFAEVSLKYFDSTANSDYNKAFYYKAKGLIYANEKKPKEALEYYNKIISITERNKARKFLRDIYPMLNTSYNEIGDFKMASKYLLKYKMENDSLYEEQKLATEYIIKKKNEIVKNQNRKRLIFFTILTFLILVISFFGGRFLWKKYIEIANREEAFLQTNPFEDVDNISQEDLALLVSLSKKDEKAFYIKFAELNPKLYQQLNKFQPKLSDSEIKFCSYLTMKYTVKEIALYTNSSVKSVESKKYRLKKKFKDSEDEILILRLNL